MNAKSKLHPRNKHNQDYDFGQLCKFVPELTGFIESKYGKRTLDFSNSDAVKLLNKALLKAYYDIDHWDIPPGFLCPPIPGRVDYIHYLADLLQSSVKGKIDHKKVRVLDIGTGANCIYPLLGHKSYGWRYVATDIEARSVKMAKQIVNANQGLSKVIEIRHQKQSNQIFQGIINEGERFHLTQCNPPFHNSAEEAAQGSQRKWKNLGKNTKVSDGKTPALNFAGRSNELWCKGGELRFVRKMVRESQHYAQQVVWFTTLVSKKDNVSGIKLALKKVNAKQVKVVKMAQGQKISRFIAWSFLTAEEQADYRLEN
ncbi:23S rRNA (adenine(1618)-N(6))-methyltransferase RlmF [Alteromonas sp. KUL49]|uniref:23S rRNA (adenine(1618)-N(6))-methyltransferase RlmF n=1 Tax=Alteromonas sp. KUL49 TaxID=2480798 RepID=UPI00102F08EB|nr:23S rRNA (adenine(1618)-N(6))-methyltransferase RlmF [Alteromonas sp. KUL49]TAP39369.1 23S rRNA (adenine(1618)-N(6))-methyltransferase RlmF [Alteromonas sp. KUL49]GEA12164.1 ribosomal RNA large subunit methyltransferase F [Alteromonas sp. KUL49]